MIKDEDWEVKCMGVYDTLIQGDLSAQVKCFDCGMNTYNVGDEVPCDGSLIIMLPAYDGDATQFAVVLNGIFVGFTGCPPKLIDKWGGDLTSYDQFVNPYFEAVRRLAEELKDKKN